MVTTVSQTRTDIAMARDTGQQTLELARAMGDLRRELQPIEGALKNIELKATTWGAQLATAIAQNAKELVAMPGGMRQLGQDAMEDVIARMIGGEAAVKQARDRRQREAAAAAAPQPQQIVMPAQDFIRGLKQAAGNGLGQRRPLDPIR
jgi:hypothetical protein